MTSIEDKYSSLLHVSCKLIGAVTAERAFLTSDHIRVVQEEQRYGRKDQDIANGAKIRGVVSNHGAFENRF